VTFDDVVNGLLERCPGSRAAAIVDPDGIAVVSSPDDPGLEALGAEYAAVLREVDEAGREFRHGGLQQFFVTAENAVVVLTSIAAGYFLVMVLDRDGLVGKARYLSRLASERLYPEFV
jgi:predicted regulator of Ras-like GTPase activity (Roadblock/LC7/MglB family)